MGVDVNVRAANGATAVHFAAHAGNVALIRELALLDADMNAHETETGATPMHWASLSGHPFACQVTTSTVQTYV
eukprot:580774-Pyramimonas_sp.AAC.1